MINKNDLKRLIEQVTKGIGLHSDSATNLLLGTAAQESGFGKYLYQKGNGPARGIFQIEPTTEKDLWNRIIYPRCALAEKIFEVGRVNAPNVLHLAGNLIYQIIMARIKYFSIPTPLPPHEDTEGMALYWKKYYNTYLGKGTTIEFIDNYNKYVRR